jgi:hypothetical protein
MNLSFKPYEEITGTEGKYQPLQNNKKYTEILKNATKKLRF